MFHKKHLIIILSSALVLVIGTTLWFVFSRNTNTLTQSLPDNESLRTSIMQDLTTIPAVVLAQTENGYQVQDDLKEGIQITYANQQQQEQQPPQFAITFPKDYKKPLDIKLDNERIIQITDATQEQFTQKTLTGDDIQQADENLPSIEPQEQYIAYTNNRKTLYYAYQKDQALNERKLKHWTVYNAQNAKQQEEKESYTFTNAKLTKNLQGQVEVRYYGDQNIKNEQAMADVDPSLLERAQKTLEKEGAGDLTNANTPADLIIPEPYYIDKNGNRTTLTWDVNSETNTLTLQFTAQKDQYPLALDPTLQFTAPGQSVSGDVITGEAAGGGFGRSSLSVGDLNSDGKMDLVVSAPRYGGDSGRVYVFYNTGNTYVSSAAVADVVITGEAPSYFGYSLATGDLNADGKTDLAVGAHQYSTGTGRAYIFYNDGSYPTTAASADNIITGEGIDNNFGGSLTVGDLNADGRVDLVASAIMYASYLGRAYIFYNDGSYPTTAASADRIITGEGTSNSLFGTSLAVGDLNADGRSDLAVGSGWYGGYIGRAYIFYNDGSIPTTAASADVIITGTTSNDFFGAALTTADLNADGRVDLVVHAQGYSTYTGRTYIFYNDGSIPTAAASADVIITGEATNDIFGVNLAAGDFNADGRMDLAVGAHQYNSNTGRTYIFYNDGSIPTAAASADVIITGETTNNYFGATLAVGDLNADGKSDLIVGAYRYSSSTGRVYVFYSQNGQINTNRSITGESTSAFGYTMTTGDLNADGRTDLAVGAYGYSTNTGRTYIFYNDGSIPTTAATADVIITGEATSNFGFSMTTGDLNADGKADLIVGAYQYSTNTGRTYIFYNDGSIPTTAATADVIITGEAASYFGISMITGDLNADGRTDLVVGAHGYSSSSGRAYIFYNDGSIPTTAASADVIITGEVSTAFGRLFTVGDLNADGRMDLAVGAYGYSANTGRTYIFYNDGSIPTTAASADVIITGENAGDFFGRSVKSGDLNADGKIDLIVGADGYATNTGRVYIFYNDGTYPSTATNADVIITGEGTGTAFGILNAVIIGDLNADGRDDLVIGATTYSSSIGRTYIFYNDGTYPSTATDADVILTGNTAGDSFGATFAVGDFNSDGRKDLVVGSPGYSASIGRVYVYETRDDYVWQMQEQSDAVRTQGIAGEELKITGDAANNYFARAFVSGDLNSDGKMDLVVGAYGYGSNTGRVYIFYNDGSISSDVNGADVVITGETNSNFGFSLIVDDLNTDGKTDLIVGAYGYSTNTGRTYIFYNDGSIPTAADSADVIITGEVTSNFSISLGSGDLNADGRMDLVVGANTYSSEKGRTYIFYNDGSIPTTAATADVIITGETTPTRFGRSLTINDFNGDGRVDLVVGANGYATETGRAYIFYSDGSIPTTAVTADVIITGENTGDLFSRSLKSGDLNADGKIDLIIGAEGYATTTGRVYIFYNDGSYPATAASADVIITGEATNNTFGEINGVAVGDLNADGKTDLIVSAVTYSSSIGRTYIFYNDGSYPSAAASADVIITGEATGDAFGCNLNIGDINADGKADLFVGANGYNSSTGRLYMYTFNDMQTVGVNAGEGFGISMATGDLNFDGKIDLVVGARTYSTSTGRAYIFYNDGAMSITSSSADVTITGGAVNDNFGFSLATGDLNADGKTDLAVGGYGYSTNTGRAYIFYNDGSMPTTAASADVVITGTAMNDIFGFSLATGDLNADGKTDLAVGAYQYSTSTGRAYIFYADGTNNFGTATCSGTPSACLAANADVTITGEATNNYFGHDLTTGDLNADGKTDLAVGGYGYSTNTGRAYIFYNDGSIPTTAASADVIIAGETTNNDFGQYINIGDLNADGKADLIVGARKYLSSTGRVYIFYSDNSYPSVAVNADIIITGEETNSFFGCNIALGEFNADGRIDLIVGSEYYSSNTGRLYVFYNDGSIPGDANGADNIMTGETINNYFGRSAAVMDVNADGQSDIVVGAYGYNADYGKIYTYISEAQKTQINSVKTRGSVKMRGDVKMGDIANTQ